jgi:hypothetical protein
VNRADRLTLQEFAAEFMSCAVCWWPEMDMRRRMEIHHLVQGAGRKHDRRNLLTLCENCHTVFHSGSKVTGLPDLNKGILLGCKRECDPDFYDPKFLASLRHKQHLGYEPEPLPAVYEEQRQKNTTGWRHRTP